MKLIFARNLHNVIFSAIGLLFCSLALGVNADGGCKTNDGCEERPVEPISGKENPELRPPRGIVDAEKPKRRLPALYLGVSSYLYKETNITDTLQTSVSAQVASPRIRLASRWFISGAVFGDVLKLTSNSSSSIHRLIANVDVDFLVLNQVRNLRFSVVGAVRYARMFVSNNNFGFKNLLYTELFPKLNLKLAGPNSLDVYFKYTPLDILSFNFNEADIVLGALFRKTLSDSGKAFLLGAEYSNLRVYLTKNHGVLATAQSLTLKTGYSF